MSTPQETRAAIAHAVAAAERRVNELMRIEDISKAEKYEMDMALDCITRGKAILKVETPAHDISKQPL